MDIQEITNNPIKEEEKRIESEFRRLTKYGLPLLFLFLVITTACYLWKIPLWKWNASIEAERWGQFGDFIGGVLGTVISIISIIFLYKAFKEQRLANVEAHEANEELVKKEELHQYRESIKQFDERFNFLLSSYYKSVLDYNLHGKDSGKTGIAEKIRLFINSQDFTSKEAYSKRTNTATTLFQEFVSENRTMVNTHMRLFYQLLFLLDTFSESMKKGDVAVYAKTLRSQLIDEELILIRYNCMSRNGKKMQEFVFKYNILKHLPILNLLEFKRYKNALDEQNINLLNDELIFWRKKICSLFTSENNESTEEYGNDFKLIIKTSVDKKIYTFEFIKYTNDGRGRKYVPLIKAFNSLSDEMLEMFLFDFHTEIFKFSHFRTYNRENSRENSFKMNHNQKQENDNTIFTISIQSKQAIIVSYSQVAYPTT